MMSFDEMLTLVRTGQIVLTAQRGITPEGEPFGALATSYPTPVSLEMQTEIEYVQRCYAGQLFAMVFWADSRVCSDPGLHTHVIRGDFTYCQDCAKTCGNPTLLDLLLAS